MHWGQVLNPKSDHAPTPLGSADQVHVQQLSVESESMNGGGSVSSAGGEVDPTSVATAAAAAVWETDERAVAIDHALPVPVVRSVSLCLF